MKEVLVLCTNWSPDYWEVDKITSYPGKRLKHIKHLVSNLPIAGIGVYTKGRKGDFSIKSPVFIIVRNIYESKMEAPQFEIHFVSKMEGVKSSEFLDEIEWYKIPWNKRLFFSIPGERVLKFMDEFDIEPPLEWQKLLETPTKSSWLDWIGKHFQEILKLISNNDYEDRVTEIFNALGFEVEQLGHKKEGEYPDGIIYTNDLPENFAVVYDCKNRSNYFLTAKDMRAMTNYIRWAKKRIEELRKIRKIYFAYIAHSYANMRGVNDIERETSTKGLLLTSEALLYLLFKKLSLGRQFLLSDFEELIKSEVITVEKVEEAY